VPGSLLCELGGSVVRRHLPTALVVVLGVVLLAPAVRAQIAGADCAACAPQTLVRATSQGDPRDPFGRDDARSGGGDATAAGGRQRHSVPQGGATSAGTLPLTGSTPSALAGVAGLLIAAGGLTLWLARYRPRHAGYRPRHAGYRPRHAR
jgi:LPXTG-motif cell wall-anchored protein